ncbi:hypothetical protein [Streptomyces griseochromogenes]|uniref:hypothetical protein n=1 Tax=Streptomyces griseochromogenes TaxID=68214 RepID=UPI001331A301|nr:hypothetical protein [Streptomyces griseochromogenes]
MSIALRRAAGPALAAGLVVSFATPAAAQTPGSTAFRLFGSLVGLQARAGVQNQVSSAVSAANHLLLTDTAGIAIGPGCARVSDTTADCGSISTGTRLLIALGDQNDSAKADAPVNTTVDAGTGVDSVSTDGGNDTISVQDNAGGDTVTCDGGNDVVFADPGDNIATDCERRF